MFGRQRLLVVYEAKVKDCHQLGDKMKKSEKGQADIGDLIITVCIILFILGMCGVGPCG